MIRSILVVAALSVSLAPPLHAKVYKWVTPDGRVVFSDKPQAENAEEVNIKTTAPAATEGAAAGPAPEAAAAPDAGENAKYKVFEIASPANDTVIRDVGGAVRVSLTLDPALRPGHTVTIFVDGKEIGSGKSTSATVTNVDRGTHSVKATVTGTDGKQIQSTPPVTFHLKKGRI